MRRRGDDSEHPGRRRQLLCARKPDQSAGGGVCEGRSYRADVVLAQGIGDESALGRPRVPGAAVCRVRRRSGLRTSARERLRQLHHEEWHRRVSGRFSWAEHRRHERGLVQGMPRLRVRYPGRVHGGQRVGLRRVDVQDDRSIPWRHGNRHDLRRDERFQLHGDPLPVHASDGRLRDDPDHAADARYDCVRRRAHHLLQVIGRARMGLRARRARARTPRRRARPLACERRGGCEAARRSR